MTLASSTITKLSKLFPRLASDHDGEVIATVRAIMRTLESSGSSLHDLGPALTSKTIERVVYRDSPSEEASQHQPPTSDEPIGHEEVAAHGKVLKTCDLNERERSFVLQMMKDAKRLTDRFTMTVRQADWWRGLVDKYLVDEEEDA
jgi:hypothetical protein